MSCGCGGANYTEDYISEWFKSSGTLDTLREIVKENPREMQELSGSSIIEKFDYRTQGNIMSLFNWSTRAYTFVRTLTDELVKQYIDDQIADSEPFEPIVIKQKETVSVR